MKAPIYAYLRVSSAGQIERDGHERQRDKINAWAKTHGHKVRFMFQEDGVSGTLDTAFRPALSSLFDRIAALPDDEIKPIVVVEKADRLARDLIIGELILRQFREAGVQVIEAEGGSDLTTGNDNPTSTLIRQILGAVAQFEKSALVLKLRAARERKKKETGRCGGSYPFGHYPGEKETLSKMQGHRSYGFTTREIATTLNHDGDATRSGKPWTFGAVAKILKNTKP